MIELRNYQEKAVNCVLNEWKEGRQRTLLVLPTGTGKTIVFAKIVKYGVDKGKRALILAHRNELLEQAREKLKNSCDLDSSLEKAESTSIGDDTLVTVGSIQTLSLEKRLTAFPKDYFDIIVVDEVHHAMSDTYQRVLKYFDKALMLGVTATPDRADHKELSDFFESKAFEYTLTQAVRDGYLCKVKAQMIPLDIDITKVNISQGDYALNQVGSALEPYLNQISLEMLNYCKGRKTVVFLPLVKTSQKFCDLLNMHGLKAAEVNCNSKNRDEILKDFENGEYDVLCNSMLLTEGWDCPSVDCIVILRPTKVRSLYQQMVGRGMRLSANKSELLLLDFLWLTERHDLCRPSSLIAKSDDVAKRIDAKVINHQSGIDLIDSADEAEKDIVQEREEALARELAAMRKKKHKLVDPIQYALSISAEDLADYQPTFTWEMAPATPKQIAFLEKYGIYTDEIPNCGYASLLIDKLRTRHDEKLASPRHIRCLERYGFRHVGMWTFEEASKMVNRIAANNWFLPRGINPQTYQP